MFSKKYADLLDSNEDITEDLPGEKEESIADEDPGDVQMATDKEQTETEEKVDDHLESADGKDATTDEDGGGEDDIQSPKTPAEDDTSGQETKSEEFDAHVKDETDITDSFDHITAAQETFTQANHTIDALEHVAEELHEINTVLNVSRKKPSEFTKLARAMTDKKLQHAGRRLGCDFRVASTENFEGDKYDDSVFVDSLEASVGDTVKRIVEVVKAWIAKAVKAGKQIWKYVTDVTRRVHKRMKSIKTNLKKTSHGETDLKRLSDIAMKAAHVQVFAIEESGTLVIKENHADIYRTRLEKFSKMMVEDAKKTQGFIQDIVQNTGISEGGGSSKPKSEVMASTAQDYIETVMGKGEDGSDMFPGGYRIVLTSGDGVKATAKRDPQLQSDTNDLKRQLVAFASNGGQLVKLADIVEKATAPSGILSKDFERLAQKYYDDLNKEVSELARKFAGEEGATQARTPSFSLVQSAVNLGFSATMSGRIVWIKAIHAASNILAVFAAQKKEEAPEEPKVA